MLGAMPSATVVVASVVVLVLVVLVLVLRSRGKAKEAETLRFEPPRFEPPREIVPRPASEKIEATEAAKAPPGEEAFPSSAHAQAPPAESAPTRPQLDERPVTSAPQPAVRFEPPPAPPPAPPVETPRVEAPAPAFASEVIPPSTEEIATDEIVEAEPENPEPAPLPPRRPAMRSYSNITDESVAEEVRRESQAPPPVVDAEAVAPVAPPPPPKLPVSEPRVAARPAISEPKAPVARPAVSEPRTPAAKPIVSEPRVPISKPAVSEPRMPAAKSASEPKSATAKPTPDEHDFSALNDAPAAKPAAANVAATVAKFAPASNPATADLEKNDPRHAAARRFARLSVSEIKLYHEDEVKAGREARDLWRRLQQDISLAKQTFDARVVPEVRERFDYLYDEILRQLAEGDVSKLGPDAPVVKGSDAAVVAVVTAPTTAPPPMLDDAQIDPEAPTRTTRRTLEPTEPTPPVAPVTPVAAKAAQKPAPIAEPAAKPVEAAMPAGLAARLAPSNPETAELEKSDPRHAAARRLARLSVSEIKLYHEDEVKAGREAKDLWTRMNADIALATQTFDKRVDKEVRERFDYLYDEILRQLAEGDVTKLGPDAPKPKTAAAPAPPPPAPVEAPKVEAPKAAPAPAAAPTAAASVAARYAPPTNPATAELEKNDPRHAAARRLARLSVSEIKLYHEDEVKAGREAMDLWTRLTADIGLATQTYEKRVDKEVRERFDYLYDEILRQLAEGDVAKLGPDAPKPKATA
jgi:hypothetical protein